MENNIFRIVSYVTRLTQILRYAPISVFMNHSFIVSAVKKKNVCFSSYEVAERSADVDFRLKFKLKK